MFIKVCVLELIDKIYTVTIEVYNSQGQCCF
jgi:hypothetical protein